MLASRGYPESSESGQPITGIDDAEACPASSVFHAGTAHRATAQLVTAGGRVLTVVGRGADFDEAIARAYAGVAQISFDGMQYRGHRRSAIGREDKTAGLATSTFAVKYSVVTFGCRVNQADSLGFEEELLRGGARRRRRRTTPTSSSSTPAR